MSRKETIASAEAGNGKSSVPAVEKALDVLELLSRAPDGLTMNEIVEALGRTMGEIYRVVVYLTERDYLRQNPDTNKYALTLQLFELSHRHDPTERLIQAAIPMLERIAAKTGQSCHLGVLSRENVLVLASVRSPMPAGYSVRTGALFPVEQTSTGHVILSFSPKESQERHLARLTEKDRKQAAERIANIRLMGFDDTASRMIDGVRNLCVPVFDSRGVAAAITSGYVRQTGNQVSAEEALSIIRVTALELSETIGFRISESDLEAVLIP